MTITNYKVILASNSPRRQELLKQLGVDFKINVVPNIDESYPKDINLEKVAEFLAVNKAKVYQSKLSVNELLITADTIVLLNNKIYGKPADKEDAIRILQELSGEIHQVISGVCLTSINKQVTFSVMSEVEFSTLTNQEIEYYVDHYLPYDKAGAYGIQEWIGYVAVKGIKGSFYNIMGLPIHKLYKELVKF